MAKKQPDKPRTLAMRVTPSKETREFAKRVESESHAYNWRQRAGLKQYQGK